MSSNNLELTGDYVLSNQALLDEHHRCSICFGYNLDMYLANGCIKHAACKSCHERWIQQGGGTCSVCRADLSLPLEAKPRGQATLNLVLIKCLAGCEWKGSWSQFERHYAESCPEAEVKCTIYSCSHVMKRREISAHEEKCAEIEEECKHCGEKLKRIHMQKHINNDCLLIRVTFLL